MGSRIFESPFVIKKGAKRKSHILTLPQKMYVQFKFIKCKTKTPVFGLINLTHYQGRKGNINNELNLRKIFYVDQYTYPQLDPIPQAR